MATMTVWKFPTAEGAAVAEATLKDLQRQELIQIHDAAIVSYPAGAKKPKTRQLTSLTGAGALGGAFWGMLFGLIFLVPLLGAAIGATAGAIGGSLADVGIDDKLIQQVRERLAPGTSALFVLSSDAVLDKVRDAFAANDKPELIFTNLTNEQEAALREVFTDEEEPAAR